MSVTDVVFLTGITFLLMHELDAIQQAEWRFFFAPFPVSDETAYRLFVVAHVPLTLLILMNLGMVGFQIGLSVFLIVHGILHTLLRNHPHIRFDSGFSRLWIYGGSLLGLAHLILLHR